MADLTAEPTSATPEYFTAFKNIALSRTDSGVLTLPFHTDGGPATFTGQLHTDLPRARFEIGEDRDNRVLVLTGTGDRFMTDLDVASFGDVTKPEQWDRTIAVGRRVIQRLVDLEMPIVAAVNGPAFVHSEYALLADIVVAADTTVFSDFPHLTVGVVPGDGILIAWEEAIGLNRTRYLTLTQGSFTAEQAERWGAVAEVLPLERVLPRATELAEQLAARPQMLTSYLAVAVWQRISRRLAEGTQLGMALEGPTAADLPYRKIVRRTESIQMEDTFMRISAPAISTSKRTLTAALEAGDLQAAVAALRQDIVFHTPLLATVADEVRGLPTVVKILQRAFKGLGMPQNVEEFQNPDGRYIVTFDGAIEGNPIQSAMLVTEDAQGKVESMSAFQRPWPVVKLFREYMERNLRPDPVPDALWELPASKARL